MKKFTVISLKTVRKGDKLKGISLSRILSYSLRITVPFIFCPEAPRFSLHVVIVLCLCFYSNKNKAFGQSEDRCDDPRKNSSLKLKFTGSCAAQLYSPCTSTSINIYFRKGNIIFSTIFWLLGIKLLRYRNGLDSHYHYFFV